MLNAKGLHMSNTATNEDIRIRQLTQELITTRQPVVQTYKCNDDAVLYRILDEATNGRKLMNYLVYSNPRGRRLTYHQSAIQRDSSAIGRSWFDKEKRASTQTTPAALQLEAPVIFSWSKKVHGTKKDQVRDYSSGSSVRETTNDTLYKRVAANLDQIKTQQDWDKQSRPFTSQNESSLSQRSQWATTSFKVDPLQPFVAKLVKEPKKKVPKKEKSPSKMKNLFSFLSNGKKDRSELIEDPPMTDNPPVTQDDKQETRDESQQSNATTDAEETDAREIGSFEQVSPPSKQILGTLSTSAPMVPPQVMKPLSFSSESPLSMDSFIPLKPKKKN